MKRHEHDLQAAWLEHRHVQDASQIDLEDSCRYAQDSFAGLLAALEGQGWSVGETLIRADNARLEW